MEFDVSRRLFFQQLVLGGVGLYFFPTLYSCDNNKYPPLKPGSGTPPFSVWEEMMYALEKSPDNLLARREVLMAAKDPEAMTCFVRDSFQVLPNRDFFRHIGTHINYGTKAAIRCGLATPREKAEILKNMLVEAGFEAKVVLERTEISEAAVKNIVFNQQKPVFEPPINTAKYKEWSEKMGVSEEQGGFEAMPDTVAKATALANNLLDKIDDASKKKDETIKFFFSENDVPSVVFMMNGKEHYAHVFDPSVPYGALHPTNPEKKFRDAYAYEEEDEDVTIALSYINAFDVKNEVELISGTWKASELVGNQIKVNFLNNMSFQDQATKSVSQIANFTPSLALQDLYKETPYLEKRSFLGEPITLDGEKIFENSIIKTNEETTNPSETIKDVVSVDITAKPKTFPRVQVDIYPKNKDGKVVEGLKAGDFSLVDNGESVTGWMRQNVIAPKILLLYDTSLSMPNAYRKEGIKLFLEQTQHLIREEYPYAKITLKETGSNIYTAHLKAAQTDYDLILYATDGDNNDSFNPKLKNVYEQGATTIYLKVTKHRQDLFDTLIENTGATLILAADQENTIAQIRNTIDQLSFPPYVFSYHSFNETEEHTISVSLKDIQLKAEDTYHFPDKAEKALGTRMIGLYLEIKIGKQSTIRRVLAGWDNKLDNKATPNVHMANSVHEMLLGGTIMAFEREGPTLSLQLTEYLKTKMSNRNWYEAHQDGDTQKAIAELGKGVQDYPSVLLSMMQPLYNTISETSVTYPKGYRVGVLKFVPGYYKKESHTSFDYLPTSNYTSVTKSGKDAFSETTRKTAQLALLENKMFKNNTLSQLEGKTLVLNKNVKGDGRYSSKTLGEDYRYFTSRMFRVRDLTLFDASAKNKSYWNINHRTGELYGILPDQTGGGDNSIIAQLEHLGSVVKKYERLMQVTRLALFATGVGGIAHGLVAVYGVTLVKLFALASEALIIMDASNLDEEEKEAIVQLSCNIFNSLWLNKLGPLNEATHGLHQLILSIGGGGCK